MLEGTPEGRGCGLGAPAPAQQGSSSLYPAPAPARTQPVRGCHSAMGTSSPPQQPLFLLGCLSRSLHCIICHWVHPWVPLPLAGYWGTGGCLPLPPSSPISPLPCAVGFWRWSLLELWFLSTLCAPEERQLLEEFRTTCIPLPSPGYSQRPFQSFSLLQASAAALFSHSPFQKQTLCKWITLVLPFIAQPAWLSTHAGVPAGCPSPARTC